MLPIFRIISLVVIGLVLTTSCRPANYTTASETVVTQSDLPPSVMRTLPTSETLSRRERRAILNRGYVRYSDFGAVGDGVVDDMPAIVATHVFANTHKLPVKADDGFTYYIGGRDLTAHIQTETDFGTAAFIIDDTQLENLQAQVFEVVSEKKPYSLDEITSLRRNQENIGITLPGPALISVTDNAVRRFIRFGRNQNRGAYQTDIFMVDKDGNVDMNAPIIWDFDRISEISVLPIDEITLNITGGHFTTIANQADTSAPYHNRGFVIRRSNVVVDGIQHYVTGEQDQGAPYGAFLFISDSANITIQNAVFTGRKTYHYIGSAGLSVPRGTYGINVRRSVNVSFINSRQSNDINDTTYWGLMGSNFSKNIVLDGVSFSRFDAHMGVANATIRNSTLGHQGINAIGTGTFLLENSTVYGRNLINLRQDYGSTWEGEFIIRNTVFVPNRGNLASPSLFGGFNSGQHDFGYTTFMPHRITIENLHIDDSNHPADYTGPTIFGNFNPEKTNGGYAEAFPYVLTEQVILRNVTTSSGRPLTTSPNRFMFRDVDVLAESTTRRTSEATTAGDQNRVEARLLHPTMDMRIGYPAILSPGEAHPSLAVSVLESGSLRIHLISEDSGTTLQEIGPLSMTAGESRTISFPGTSAEGRYSLRMDVVAGNDLIFRDAWYFTVLDVKQLPEHYSVAAHPGNDGRLVYTPDFRGNRIPDFSMVGYRNSGEITEVPVRLALDPQSGDDTERIQSAINAVSAMPPDENGFRGAVLLKRGVYEIAGTLYIRASGVVLRGEGQGDFKELWLDPALGLSLEELRQSLADKEATTLIATGPEMRWIIRLEGIRGVVGDMSTATEILDNYVPVGARSFTVGDAQQFSVGDSIIVERRGNARWIHEIGMDDIPVRPTGDPIVQWSPVNHQFEYVITAIDGNRITIHSTIHNAIEQQWGGGRVFKYSDSGRISNVGVENLRGISYWRTNEHGVDDTRHADMFLLFDTVRDGWARNLTLEHFYGRSAIMTGKNSLGVTISESSNLIAPREFYAGEGYDPSGRTFFETGVYTGRYGFHFEGQNGLVKDSYAVNNRHAFIVGAWVTGPNVFLNSSAEESLTFSEPHHRWSVAGLFDNISDKIYLMNRLSYGSGHGWAGANYVAWNTDGTLVTEQPPTAQNWAIGHTGEKRNGPFHNWNMQKFGYSQGYWEAQNIQVEPKSLYLKQLQDRLEGYGSESGPRGSRDGLIPTNGIYNRLGVAPIEGGFAQDDYWVWGSSVIKSNDDKYHMFVSRWPKYLPFHPGWLVASEIVHAVSDTPEGPYTYVDVALPARGPEYWDGRSTHNPRIFKHDDTYVLIYMGSTHPFDDVIHPDTLTLTSAYTTVARANKRIGMATSKSPYGPWERRDLPILDTKPGTFYSFLTSNPSPWINEDGSVIMLFKSRSYKEDYPFQSSMMISVATAPSIHGPFEVVGSEPVFGVDKMGEIEDPFLWKDENGYHMLAKDQRGSITGNRHAGILAHSIDGVHWVLDENPLAYTRSVTWSDGETMVMGQLERVFGLIENGRITHLFFATMDGPGGFANGTRSWNMVIPMKD